MQFCIYFIHDFLPKGIKNFNKDFNINEPFKNLFTQGMVCHESYKDKNGIGYILKKLKKLMQKLHLKK